MLLQISATLAGFEASPTVCGVITTAFRKMGSAISSTTNETSFGFALYFREIFVSDTNLPSLSEAPRGVSIFLVLESAQSYKESL